MKFTFLTILAFLSIPVFAQNVPRPCTTDPHYRQFDFWIGDWEVYNVQGQQAGQSQVQLMLDSCVIYENWTSAGNYAGKSFNLYNRRLQQWQQTWVDDKGGLTEYFGNPEGNNMVLTTKPFMLRQDTMAIRKMTFYRLAANKVRQHGEISKDDGRTWATEFDLEYRRKD